ncbi:MAG: hypothetical protein OXC12_14145 [Spirochaetaceae bacterium]|nr:hypothetical protein [Spirochaetaceae bacterium]
MDEGKQLAPAVVGGTLLAGTGVAVLLANVILLNPVSRTILSVAAAGWGVWVLIAQPHNRRAGWTALACGAGMFLFGSLLKGLVGFAGAALIVAGGISALSGLFRRSGAR